MASRVREYLLEVGKKLLLAKGILEESITLDKNSGRTFEEAVNFKRLAKIYGIESAMIVSNPYHMGRVNFTFEKVSRALNFGLLFIPAERDRTEEHFLKNEQSLVYVFDEFIKLSYHFVRY